MCAFTHSQYLFFGFRKKVIRCYLPSLPITPWLWFQVSILSAPLHPNPTAFSRAIVIDCNLFTTNAAGAQGLWQAPCWHQWENWSLVQRCQLNCSTLCTCLGFNLEKESGWLPQYRPQLGNEMLLTSSKALQNHRSIVLPLLREDFQWKYQSQIGYLQGKVEEWKKGDTTAVAIGQNW